MGITRNNRQKRRATGGKKKHYRMNRKFEMGRQPTYTKIGERKTTAIRMRGGKEKTRAIRLDAGNFSWATEGIARKTRILSVSYNSTSNELVRTNTLVKNAIIQIDATPFRAWYEHHYGIKLGKKKKVAKKGGKPAAPGKKGAKPSAKAPAKPAAGKKVAKEAAKKAAVPAKKGTKEAAKTEKKAAKPAKEGGYVEKKHRPVSTKLARARAAYAKRAKLSPTKRAQVVRRYIIVNAQVRKLQKIRAAAIKARAEAVAAAKAAGQPIPPPLRFQEKKNRSIRRALSRAQLVHRKKRVAAFDPHLHDQFLTGRLYACIASRPGQDGCADGYILEGKELDFYVKKMKK